ncbi:MAG TPA: phosphate-starvation-inducible PsiE family protein [Draconibacterium sp.]|nr:phosphate-starvation-inducible PsiE family protein [Draconibacterium sp.]
MNKRYTLENLLIFGEKIIYALIVLFLFVGAFLLVYDEIITIFSYSVEANGIQIIIEIISKTLLLLMIIEILVTVRISIKEHTVCAEPFFIIGLIASIRRILIISVETAYMHEYFKQYMIEIGVLVGLSLAFVVSIALLRRSKTK